MHPTSIDTSKDSEPIRLFASNFLEFFTHISPITVTLIWLPVSVIFLALGWMHPVNQAIWWIVPLGFLIGIILWTPSEYLLHRFLFHYKPKNPWQERLSFLFHGVHHAQPQCKTRLVMPPVVSIPMALVLYGILTFIIGLLLKAANWVPPVFAGFMLGYLIYDLIHYATHHFPMKSGYLKYLKRYHMQHHYKTPDQRFGVSSPIWDKVFGTMPE
jgi:sterol desaturase/sphingolipid hydroxylase (fatty acid hydroxylase superfamily)